MMKISYLAWVAIAFTALAFLTLVLGLILQRVLQRARTLRSTGVVLAASTVVLALAAALIASRLMLLEAEEFRAVLVVLGLSAAFGCLLAVVLTRSLAADVRRLGEVARRVADGDLTASTGITRRDEIGDAAHALDQLVRRLEELEQARAGIEAERRAVITSISHDLRTPLTALRVAVEALADGVAPDPDRYLASMQQDLSALATLIDDLFMLGRIEAGRRQTQRERIDLSEVIDEAAEALAPMAHSRDVRIDIEVPGAAVVVGDPAELGRVVRNLIDNAIQHCPSGGRVVCQVECGPEISVTVTDDGVGFHAEFVSQAFEPFTRDDRARSRHTGGAGLGLAIAHGLIAAHGGRIWITPGTSGRVSFALPRAVVGESSARSG